MEEILRATEGFSAECRLGEGNFGIVFKGRLDDGQEVAVKVFKAAPDELVIREIITITQLSHPNIVSCHGWARSSSGGALELPSPGGASRLSVNPLCIVYEFVSSLTLEDWLDLNGSRAAPRPLSWPERVAVLLDVARGMAHLHKLEIVHRDLRSANVLLRPDGRAVLADFGLAILLPPGGYYSTACFTTPIGYADPEIVVTGVVTPQSDVYGFGVMVMECVTGQRGFSRQRRQHALVRLVEAEMRSPGYEASLADRRAPGEAPAHAVKTLLQLARGCVCLQSERRPKADEVLAMVEAVADLVGVQRD